MARTPPQPAAGRPLKPCRPPRPNPRGLCPCSASLRGEARPGHVLAAVPPACPPGLVRGEPPCCHCPLRATGAATSPPVPVPRPSQPSPEAGRRGAGCPPLGRSGGLAAAQPFEVGAFSCSSEEEISLVRLRAAEGLNGTLRERVRKKALKLFCPWSSRFQVNIDSLCGIHY